LNAPTVTLPEALGSPPNTRVSVTGYVIDVSDVKETDAWKRREVTITDNAVILLVKLWNDAVSCQLSLAIKCI